MSFVIRNRHRLHGTCFKKKNKVFFSSPDYLIYTRTRRPALYVYNIIYITHAYPHPPRPYYICRIGTYPVRRSAEPTDLFRTSIFLLHIIYCPRRAGYMFSYILYTYARTAVAVNRAGGKFYRPTGHRLPVFGAEAAVAAVRAYAGAIIIHCRLSATAATASTAVDYLYRIHDRPRWCHIMRIRRPERDHEVPEHMRLNRLPNTVCR